MKFKMKIVLEYMYDVDLKCYGTTDVEEALKIDQKMQKILLPSLN